MEFIRSGWKRFDLLAPGEGCQGLFFFFIYVHDYRTFSNQIGHSNLLPKDSGPILLLYILLKTRHRAVNPSLYIKSITRPESNQGILLTFLISSALKSVLSPPSYPGSEE